MKTLIIGFIVLLSWSALSTYIYVCKIKGFCPEREIVKSAPSSISDLPVPLTSPKAEEKALVPETFSVFFAFDKSDFTFSAKSNKNFEESTAYMLQNSAVILNITGYTDAIGSDAYNQALGLRRAQSVQNYFERKGMVPAKIIIESKGEKEPADDNLTSDGRANNRRTVIKIKI